MATITEDFVSFETAKLLKEKGFDIPCDYAYNNKAGYFEVDRSNFDEVYCFRPSFAMAMKWLREVHKIHPQIWILEEKGYWFNIEKIINAQYKHKSLYSTGLENIYFETYEQACEEAIKYCLEHLIN